MMRNETQTMYSTPAVFKKVCLLTPLSGFITNAEQHAPRDSNNVLHPVDEESRQSFQYQLYSWILSETIVTVMGKSSPTDNSVGV